MTSTLVLVIQPTHQVGPENNYLTYYMYKIQMGLSIGFQLNWPSCNTMNSWYTWCVHTY